MTDITEKISAHPGTFRRGTLTDVPAVTALYRACAQAGQAEGSSVWDEEYPGEEEARADAESGALFVLEDGGALLSAVSLLPADDLDELDCWTGTGTCALSRLAVSPRLQGQGIGRAMMERLCREAAGQGYLGARFLSAKNNPRACRLYDGMGFSRVGETHMYGLDFFCYEADF